MKNINNESMKHTNTERCILCNKDTHIPVELNIDFRDYYIEGIGQLCIHCYREYIKTNG